MKNKKNKQKLYTSRKGSEKEYSTVIKIAVGVIVAFALTYLLAGLITGEIKFGDKKETPADVEIQYEEIMAGQTFNRPATTYYVMLFNFTDSFASYYLSLKDTYTATQNHLPFYIVDLEKSFNSQYVLNDGETLINKPSSLNDFKVVAPTIIKIQDSKVVERISGKDSIFKFFEENN